MSRLSKPKVQYNSNSVSYRNCQEAYFTSQAKSGFWWKYSKTTEAITHIILDWTSSKK